MYILDRFEGEYALLISKDGGIKTVPREDLGEHKEGDAFRISDDGAFIFDEEFTKSRKESVKSRFARLVKRK